MLVRSVLIRLLYILALGLIVAVLVGIILLLEAKMYVFNQPAPTPSTTPSFPVGINVVTATIVEQPNVDQFFSNNVAHKTPNRNDWHDVVVRLFASKAWFQNLASPVQRIAVIWPGERHEEVARHFGGVLGWDTTNRDRFVNLIQTSDPILNEGKFIPGRYTVHKDATPEEVADLIYQEFSTQILERYPDSIQHDIPIETALTIASLLEREASDFENMREVSGVIWNRLFIDMPLQLDATLQYVRGSEPYEPEWWPVPRPSDKFLDSPFNTYQNTGLPPGPIANPSTEAVLAALNPRKTDCLFYFHANDGSYYCSVTYEEHVKKITICLWSRSLVFYWTNQRIMDFFSQIPDRYSE